MECPKGSPLLLIESYSAPNHFISPEGLDFHRRIMTWLFCIRHTKSKNGFYVFIMFFVVLSVLQWWKQKFKKSIWTMNCYSLRLQFESLNKNLLFTHETLSDWWALGIQQYWNWKLPCKAVSLVKRHETNLSFKCKIYFCLLASFILKVILG